jgi:transcriptional antiterminator RfaH
MRPKSQHIVHDLSVNNKLSIGIIPQTPKWYAIYTRQHHEKKVYAQLHQKKIEAYLPLQTTIRQWSDRKKKISEPLFNCYLFVNVTSKTYYSVLNVPGVVRYICFEGKAAVIPDKQIKLIQNLLGQDLEVLEISESFKAGIKVKIKAGPLIDTTGLLVEYIGKKRVIIRIDEINKSILVNVPLNFLALA